MEHQKAIYLDMDGTFVDLYGERDWLEKLRNEDFSPYLEARPLVNLDCLVSVLNRLREKGYRIGVISHLSMDASRHYKEAIRAAKRLWLNIHIESRGFIFDELHFVKYGSPKRKAAKFKNGLLFDDNDEVVRKWGFGSFNVSDVNLIVALEGLL